LADRRKRGITDHLAYAVRVVIKHESSRIFEGEGESGLRKGEPKTRKSRAKPIKRCGGILRALAGSVTPRTKKPVTEGQE
jgi:hypothetical protein